MVRLMNFLMLVAVVGIVAAGCGTEPNPIDSREASNLRLTESQKIVIPAGAVFESATLNLNATMADGQTINVHRVTSAWDEMIVTWDNFGGAYDGFVWGSFTASATGLLSVDVTALVQAWLDGTYDNYGFLLAAADFGYPRVYFDTKEAAANHPYLTFCYSVDGVTTCVDDFPIGDTQIWELTYLQNFGDYDYMGVGWGGVDQYGLQKQILIQFETEPMMELAAIGDYVWIDTNRDGVQDAGEPGFPDVEVELYDCQDNFIAITLTDADGYYLFDGLMPGDYYVKFIRPEAYVFTLQNIGDDASDSDADPATGLDACTNLEGGETDLTHDAGLYRRDMEGCTLTIGFWKNHAGFGPQDDVLSQYLDIWLGTAGGTKSMLVNSAAMAVDILKMKTYGHPSNGFTKLYAQLLGAKLNMAAGADYSAIEDELAEADELLAMYDWTDWDSFSRNEKKNVVNLMSIFDDYNNGDIGPGHCDDFGDGYDD